MISYLRIHDTFILNKPGFLLLEAVYALFDWVTNITLHSGDGIRLRNSFQSKLIKMDLALVCQWFLVGPYNCVLTVGRPFQPETM